MTENWSHFESKQRMAFSIVKPCLIDIFKNHDFDENSVITKENAWFLVKINSSSNLNSRIIENSILHWETGQILKNILEKTEGKSFLDFLNELIETLLELHLQIQKKGIEIHEILKKSDILSQIYTKIIEEKNIKILKDLNPSQNPTFLLISYVKNRRTAPRPSNFYKLKYRAAFRDDFEPIFTDRNQAKKCILNFNSDDTILKLQIWGREVEPEYKLITQIDFPLIELFISIKPIDFINEELAPIYLILDYEIEEKGQKMKYCIELKFVLLNCNSLRKIEFVNKILEYNKTELERLRIGIKKRLALIDEILNPFNEAIYYDIEKGLVQKKENKNGVCNYNCLVF